LVDGPLAVLEEAAQQLDRGRVETSAGVLDLLVELAAVDALDALIDEIGIGEVGDEVVEAARLDRLEHTAQGFPGRGLRIGLRVPGDAVAFARLGAGRAGQDEEGDQDRQDARHESDSRGWRASGVWDLL